MMRALERLWFRIRTRQLARDLDHALELRRRGRAERQARAKRGASTRYQHRMEGLKR